jgi:hypothetical protein
MAALLNYRTNGYEALKTTWLTDEYAQEMNYTDFLAASVNNMPTTPSALMGWEIQKVENETDTTKPQGSMRALVKTLTRVVRQCAAGFCFTPTSHRQSLAYSQKRDRTVRGRSSKSRNDKYTSPCSKQFFSADLVSMWE